MQNNVIYDISGFEFFLKFVEKCELLSHFCKITVHYEDMILREWVFLESENRETRQHLSYD